MNGTFLCFAIGLGLFPILLQDTLTEDGETTQERAVVLDALEKTLTLLDK